MKMTPEYAEALERTRLEAALDHGLSTREATQLHGYTPEEIHRRAAAVAEAKNLDADTIAAGIGR